MPAAIRVDSVRPIAIAAPLAPRVAKPPIASGTSSCRASTPMYSEINALGCVAAAPAIVATLSNARSYHAASSGKSDSAFIMASSLPSSSLYSSVLPAVPMSCSCCANLPNAVLSGAIPNRVDIPLKASKIPPPAFIALARKF